jgi:hypothetical protein
MRLGDGVEHPPGADRGVFRALHLGKHDDELVPALAADRVRRAHALDQPLRDRLQELVAGGMAEGVVDVLEPVQVEEEHRDLLLVARGEGDGLRHAVVQEHAVRQAGQEVVLGRMRHLYRDGAGEPHVPEDDHGPGALPPAVVDGRDGRGDGDVHPVPAHQDRVRGERQALMAAALDLHGVGNRSPRRRVEDR